VTAPANGAGPQRRAGCPKRMVYGPCGGVHNDLTCEMAPVPCPFPGGPPVIFEAEASTGTQDLPQVPSRGSMLTRAATLGPVIVTDLSVRPFDAGSVRQVAGALAGSCDALLVGEHQDTPDFPPALMASLILDAGGCPWITLTCRDRNRLVLEQELAGLRHAGADGVLCVTGDGRAPGVRPGVTQVFDLDGTRLAAMAASAGLCTAVPESPAAAPVALRPWRLLEKQRAGAELCILNHVSSPADARAFAASAREAGVTLPLIAAVAVYTDERSAVVLQGFPGLQLNPRTVQSVLSAPDPVAAGIAAAVAEAGELLAIDGIAGVNISGMASDHGHLHAAEIKAAVGHAIRAEAG
jgi:methylenetetrahydrofolate reductase (NADPH)